MRKCRLCFVAIVFLSGLTGKVFGQPPGGFGQRPARRPSPDLAEGVVCRVASKAAGDKGIAVRVLVPQKPRYEQGAPVVVHVAGGVHPGEAAGPPEFAGLGFVEIYFAFPGGGHGEAASGGTSDFRGPQSVRALADVIRFATGRIADQQGRKIDDVASDIAVLKQNCGLIGSSNGGNACGVVMAQHGEEFPDLAFYASMESPYGEGAVAAELGGFETGVNPAYNPQTGVLDFSRLAWSAELAPTFFRPVGQPGSDLKGALFFDIDGDNRFTPGKDFAAHALVCDVGQGVRAYYSPRLVREAERRALFGKDRPQHLPTLADVEEFWRYRDAAGSIAEAVRKCPNVAVIVYAGEKDHVQAAPDHPHILAQIEGFRQAKARFVRLNPDRCYLERILEAAAMRSRELARPFVDNDAGVPWDRRNIRNGLEPTGLPISIYMQAVVCELADRVQAKDWSVNLKSVLYPSAALATPPMPRPGFDRPRRSIPGEPRPPRFPPPQGAPEQEPPAKTRPIGERPSGLRAPSPDKPYGAGVKELEVDAGKVVGKIRSLSGVNRGPLSFPRSSDTALVSHVESYRRLGIDFIRTHDFYGPTDWYVIFPNWTADPLDPASYDFRSSDARIRAIVENGFRCFYRLGTSWKGGQARPINDPPGTVRGTDGRVTHQADRTDFQKWASICAQTVRHYTEAWNNGFRYPIEYWEIWNEPDLAAQFWTGTPEQYYLLYEEAAKAIKAVSPQLKVGGPACTGGLREAYVESFVRYCADHEVPLDFFSWHSYGGRGDFNPYQYYQDATRIRKALDQQGFQKTENILTEWNAGIQQRLFSNTPAGAAFYASTLACLLDAGVDFAFQYCGDQHFGLGLHDLQTGQPRISAYAFAAWKGLLETPVRLAANGSDQRGYNVVAGRSTDGRRACILISDFQSGYNAVRVRARNLPWGTTTPVKMKRRLLDAEHRLEVVEEKVLTGRELTVEFPFRSQSLCLIELESADKERFSGQETGSRCRLSGRRESLPMFEGSLLSDLCTESSPR